jgi:hypothetical protein
MEVSGSPVRLASDRVRSQVRIPSSDHPCEVQAISRSLRVSVSEMYRHDSPACRRPRRYCRATVVLPEPGGPCRR